MQPPGAYATWTAQAQASGPCRVRRQRPLFLPRRCLSVWWRVAGGDFARLGITLPLVAAGLYLAAVVPARADAPAPTPDAGQSAPRHRRPGRIRFGPEVAVYLPESGKTRSRFGSAWLSVGVGIGGIRTSPVRGKFSPDFDLFYQTRGRNHAFFLPFGLDYRRSLYRARVAPYVGATAEACITDIHTVEDNIASRYRMAYGGSVYAGVAAGRNLFGEVRYYGLTRVRGIDLSGVNLKLGYRF